MAHRAFVRTAVDNPKSTARVQISTPSKPRNQVLHVSIKENFHPNITIGIHRKAFCRQQTTPLGLQISFCSASFSPNLSNLLREDQLHASMRFLGSGGCFCCKLLFSSMRLALAVLPIVPLALIYFHFHWSIGLNRAEEEKHLSSWSQSVGRYNRVTTIAPPGCLPSRHQ